MFYRNILITHTLCGFLRKVHHTVCISRNVYFIGTTAAACNFRKCRNCLFSLFCHCTLVDSHVFQKLGNKSFLLRKERQKQMQGINLLVGI